MTLTETAPSHAVTRAVRSGGSSDDPPAFDAEDTYPPTTDRLGVGLPDCFTSGEDWHVRRVRSRQEKILAEELGRRGVHHYLPLVRRTRTYGRQRVKTDLPLFPGYVFLRGDVSDIWRAEKTHRIAGVLNVVDQRRLDAELRNLYLATSVTSDFDPFPCLTCGRRVRVIHGRFTGIEGIIDHRSPDPNRLGLQIELLGQSHAIPIDCDDVELIEDYVAPA